MHTFTNVLKIVLPFTSSNESPYRNTQRTLLDSGGLKLETKPPATERECNLLKYNCFVHFCV